MLKSLGIISLGGLFPLPEKCMARESLNNTTTRSVEDTDILVVGGGTAGVVAAIQAARAGCKVSLVENGSMLGGTMTTGGVSFPGLFHAWGKQVIAGIGWELVSETVALNNDVLPDFSKPFGHDHSKHQIALNAPLYALLAEEKCKKAGVNMHYYETPERVYRKKTRWHVEVVGKGCRRTIICKQLIDCTGNASIASLAGYNRQKEEDCQPGSLIFELTGYDYEALDSKQLNKLYENALKQGTLLKTDAYNGIMSLLAAKNGLATQHVLNADSSTSALHTDANLNGRESLLRILRFVRTLPGCENTRIKKMQSETAIRETFRIEGLYRITVDDYMEGRIFPDSLSYSYYPIDLHVTHGVEPKHLAEGKVGTIPLRALIPKDSWHFIVAGRCISSDRLANSALRVQASCMGMGQIAGAAAVLACKYNCSPSEVPLSELKKLIRHYGGIVPGK